MDTLQAVMLAAIGSVGLILVKFFYPVIRDFCQLAIEIVIEN